MRKYLSFRKIVLYMMIGLITYFSAYIYFTPYNKALDVITYYYGSKGDRVSQIQQKLKNWQYYDGAVDGVYGYGTYTAVKKFQQKNGLNVDGVVGDDTLKALGIYITSQSNNENSSKPPANGNKNTTNNQDVQLLARLINGEARGEPYEGQVAVGAVILNRTRDSRFPSTIAGVIYQPGAFTAIVDGQINAEMQQSSTNAAIDALNGWDPSGGAVYYFNPATATSAWIWSRPLIKVIGKHRFCS
ncbi:spore cortex-lytic enzyme [Clostridium peptidivorans]|uniref:spore cortex-lytic enzyme n=1 Tax=Clostridium peptidivorans TaxID=100174 RepID=UPI000BE23036|nr:spore cortex-lytic enzyme [Clostridium peptidivorans]